MSAVSVYHNTSSSLCSLALSEVAFQEKLKKINPQKSHGVMVKIVAAEFGPCLANFSRLSYRRGCYPFQWTMGKAKVLWKSGDKEDCSNY